MSEEKKEVIIDDFLKDLKELAEEIEEEKEKETN